MHFSYSAGGRPLLALRLALPEKSLMAEPLLDSGADVNVLPRRFGDALGGRWDDHKTTLRLSGPLTGMRAIPLVVMASIEDLPPVRLAFAWCQTEEVPLVLGQTNFLHGV
jgi:hypothetical protein